MGEGMCNYGKVCATMDSGSINNGQLKCGGFLYMIGSQLYGNLANMLTDHLTHRLKLQACC